MSKHIVVNDFCLWHHKLKVLERILTCIIILTESSKSLTSNAQSIKWRVGTCLYQVGYKDHLINCKAVIRL